MTPRPSTNAPLSLNLVPLQRLESRRRRRRVVAWSLIAAAYSLAIVATALVVHGPAARSLHDIRRAAREATQEAETAATKREQTMKVVASKMRVLEASQTVGQHPDWSVLLAAIAAARGDSIVLTTLELGEAETRVSHATTASTATAQIRSSPVRHDDFKLRLLGMGTSHSEVMGFVARLEELGPLQNVTVVDARTGRVGSGELTNFELVCRIADVPDTGGAK
ncbi:MAG: hypothetical protein KF768_04345 [Phycisphaeraceae bacterium]|nr:hypothetical protein [Phycisphaeraceae bacterium]